MAKKERNRPARSELTTKELAYVLAYTCVGSPECGMQGKSAIKAGFDEKDADRHASRLMKKPQIRAAIQEVHRSMMDASLINPSKILADLENTKNLALAKGDLTAANRSIHLQGQYLTMFGDKYTIEDNEQTREFSATEKIEMKLITEILMSDEYNKRRKELIAAAAGDGLEEFTNEDMVNG